MNEKEEVFSVSYLKNATRKSDLIKRLNELHKSLSMLSQDESQIPDELKLISKQLVSERILAHSDKDIRLVASCCLVDIFRIYAPDAPFGDEDMVAVFEVIISQLRSLATNDTSSGIGMKTFYILNSLSTFKSCVLTSILAENGVKGAAELVVSLFDALISSIRSEHNEEINNHMVNVLQACIEESSDLDQDVLDILLSPLLPTAKAENPAAYILVGNVLRRVASTVINPITQFINHILVGTGSSDKGSELADQVHSLIYELHKISPSLLLRVLPNVSMQLSAEEDTVRVNAVKLLGRLFASSHADYCVEFQKNFREFLQRSNDKSIEIRSEMVECMYLIMKRKPTVIAQLEDHLVKRLSDPEHDIRLLALNKIVEMASIDLVHFSAATYQALGERLKDRKVEIRKASLQGLSKLYFRSISSLLPSLDTVDSNQSIKDVVVPSSLERIGFVPSSIFKCWGFPDQKHLVIQLIQEYILPKTAIGKNDNNNNNNNDNNSDDNDLDGRRATALLLLFSLLDDNDKQNLGNILSTKRKLQIDLDAFLDSRSKLSSSSSSQDSSLKASYENNFKRYMYRLSNQLPSVDKKNVSLEKLHSMKDKTVFKLLSRCTLPDDNIVECCSNRENLKQRVDSKSVLGQHMEYLYDMAGYLLVNAEMCNHMLEYLTRCEDASEHAVDAAELISLFAKHIPSVFNSSSSLLEEWLTMLINSTSSSSSSSSKRKNKPSSLLSLRLLYSCISTFNDAGICLGLAENSESLCKVIISSAQDYSNPEICELLAAAATRIALVSLSTSSSSKSNETLMIQIIKLLSSKKHLSLTSDRLSCDLSILAGIVRIPTLSSQKINYRALFSSSILPVIKKVRHAIIEFITLDLLNNDDNNDVHNLEAGLKLWTYLLSSEDECESVQIKSKKSRSSNSNNNDDDNDDDNSGQHLLSTDMKALLSTIFDCLDSKGHKLGLTDIDDKIKRSHVYEVAACCGMHLLKVKSVGENISISQWHTLAWTLLHDDTDTRKNIMMTLQRLMQFYPLHPRFLIYPCLLATDDALSGLAKASLRSAIARLRATHEELCSRALLEDSDELRQLAEYHIPETIVPYALHLLSYHPDFPESADAEMSDKDKKRLKGLVKSLNMILDVLNDTLKSQSENLSFLMEQVNMISQHFEDKHDPQNIGLHFISRLTFKLLKERAKTGEELQPYPGDINLPIDLYRQKKNTKGKIAGLEDADQVIDKAVASSKTKQTHRHKSPLASSSSLSLSASKEKKETKPKEVKVKKMKIIQEEAIPERASSRQTKKASYKEADENDDEVEEWHRNAGSSSSSSSKQKSSKNKRTFNNNDDDNDNDDDDDEVKENKPKKLKENRLKNSNNNDDDDDDSDNNNNENDNINKKKSSSSSSSKSKQLDLKKFMKTTNKNDDNDNDNTNSNSNKKRKGKKPIDSDDNEDEDDDNERPLKAAKKPIRG